MDILWYQTQFKINRFMEETLSDLESKYGEYGAPFRCPAKYSLLVDSAGRTHYLCEVAVDFPNEGKIIVASDNPDDVYDQVEKEIAMILDEQSKLIEDRSSLFSM
jgi:hypothetical protein